MAKKIKIGMIIFFILIVFFFFLFFSYKKGAIGKDIHKESKYEIAKKLLEVQSYEAILEVTVQTKKTTNQYLLEQSFLKSDYAKQKTIAPKDINHLEIIYNGNTLTIHNINLGVSKLYTNYPYINENNIWLSSFLTSKLETMKIIEKEEEILLQTTDNPYQNLKTLHIHKKTKLPTKMEIIDNSTQTKVYIEYKEIKLNTDTKRE